MRGEEDPEGGINRVKLGCEGKCEARTQGCTDISMPAVRGSIGVWRVCGYGQTRVCVGLYGTHLCSMWVCVHA